MRLWCGFQPEVASQRLPLLWDCHPRIPGQVDPTLGTTGSTGTDQGTDTSISGRTFTSRCGRPDPSGLRALCADRRRRRTRQPRWRNRLAGAGGVPCSRDALASLVDTAAGHRDEHACADSDASPPLLRVERSAQIRGLGGRQSQMEHAAGFRHAENGQCLYYVHETLKAIYNRHSESDFDSELEEGKEVIKEMMQAMLGVELEGEIDLRAPEQMFAQAGEKMQRKMVQEEQLQQEQQAKRQKSARTLAKEQRAKEAAQHISKSLQEVYRKLASSLHPDKELDLAERMRKTELMQQLNTAYEKKDLLHLLELQLTAE